MYIGNETLLLSSETLLKRIFPGVKKKFFPVYFHVFPGVSHQLKEVSLWVFQDTLEKYIFQELKMCWTMIYVI